MLSPHSTAMATIKARTSPAPSARSAAGNHHNGLVYELHATAKLRAALGPPAREPVPASTTTLDPWYAHRLPWRRPVAFFVNEATLLPVLLPLAPSATLLARFPDSLAVVLSAIGCPATVIEPELERMREIVVSTTASRSVLGSINEFAYLARPERWPADLDDYLLDTSIQLTHTPCRVRTTATTIFPDRAAAERLGFTLFRPSL